MSHPTGTSTPRAVHTRATQTRWMQAPWMRALCVLALLCGAGAAIQPPMANAAEVEGRDATTTTLYKGRVGERPVSLYLKSEPAPCGGDRRLISAIYRYDGVSKWLLLQATDDRKGHLALVESGLGTGVTGAMMLTDKSGMLKGKWISPDGERLLPVQLSKTPVGKAEREKLDDQLERTVYENNDC
ncbi:hypothetical protein [Lysobacter capsici]|uniref:hypothetical protein n=1 Tax=Lysobacter capsici TaxID=435897 RepID=UPI001C0025C0|nr:hypothetical protein [Lysobacter capsici]QWF17188.1 hypothetical protein KME82_26265 [Lysobacter capsici]